MAITMTTQAEHDQDDAAMPTSVAVTGVDQDCAAHEAATLQFAAARVAGLLGLPRHDNAAQPPSAPRYWIPAATLTRTEAQALGIRDETGLWGGIVPLAFVATKLVSHPLWPGAAPPPGWQAVTGVEACTLPGWSVFTREAALEAGRALLRQGPVRAKSPYARGGHGQVVLEDASALLDWLASPEAIGVAAGLVLELDLAEAVTYSVGASEVGDLRIAYHGQQREVRDPAGRMVFGGSRLTVHPGSLPALADRMRPGDLADAVAVATAYDSAVRRAYGVVASRRNYDVIVGVDREGRRQLGVLEQSWRFGGASMAEVLAMECFRQQPAMSRVVAETVESYTGEPLPADAVVYWPGGADSPRKHARIVEHGC